MRLLDWQAMAIAACLDNIYAETIACEQATLLAAEWYAKLAPDGKLTVIIQGDILPLIQFLNYNARLRYAGVQQHLINIEQTALLQLPTHTFAHLPREGNAIADHLAGVGAEMPPPGRGVDIHSHTPLPASLLNKVKMYHLPQEQSLTLHERPHIHHPPLAAYWQQHPAHRQDLVRYLAKHKAHATVSGLQMTYWRTSGDGKGRFYAQGPAAQRLPKELRILLFGRTHIEIDIIGAFYEIIRRMANRLRETENSSTLPVLPTIEQARQAKLSTDIHQAANAVCHHLSKPQTYRSDKTVRNRNFYHLESVEATYMIHIIQGLQQAQPQCSIVLLHDGLLVSLLPSQSTLARLHEEALRCAGLQTGDTPFLLLTNHRDSNNQLIQQLPPSNSRTLQALSTAIAAVNLLHLHQPPRPLQTLGRSTQPPPTSSHVWPHVNDKQGSDVPCARLASRPQ